MTEIMIDPNVRVEGDLTFSGFEDVRGAMPTVGQRVLVREPESNLVASGTVARVDSDDSLIYIRVEWGSLRPDVLQTPDQLRQWVSSLVQLAAAAGPTWATSQLMDHTAAAKQLQSA